MKKEILTVVDNFLPEEIYQNALELLKLHDIKNDYTTYEGKRKHLQNRYYITKESSKKEKQLAEYFKKRYHIENSLLKLELVNDYPGFFLNKHCDHKEKTFNIVIYIEGDIESGATFALDEELKVDFLPNRALFFDTTVEHWVDKIKSKRRVLLVTWVDKTLWKNKSWCYDN